MFKRLTNLIALCIFFNTLGAQTCDVDLIGYDPVTHDISVAILNGENCGCNEYTQQDDNTCGPDNSSSTVMNNESITHFVFGLHIYEDYTEGPCSQANYHPGWTFAYPPDQTMLPFTGGHVTGDTVNVQLNTFFDWECLLDADLEEGQCWQLVVWQINLSQSADINDFPTEFWTDTCGTCAEQTQMYPDVDLSNNSIVWCPDELPPPPLYPGCMDSEAENYDPAAGYDDGTCTYPPILGCTDPTACNYNQFATENNDSCIYCDTPNGEAHCNAYHNSDTYWEFYCSLFDCCEEELTVDIELDSLWVYAANCNIFNQPQGACVPGIRYHTIASNVGQDSIYSYLFEWTGPNGFSSSAEYGVNFNGGDNFYAVPLPPGVTGNTINSFTQDMEWEEGDELCVVVSVLGQDETVLSNNSMCITLPAMPICIWGCTDPCADNYNPDATCDNENCEYPDPIVDTVYVELPQDTIFIETIDTIFVELPQDTLVVELPGDTVFVELPPDTITVVEYVQITDTLEIEVIEYIYLTDTIVEVQFIDCNTGLPCEDPPGGPEDDDCWPWAVYIPNTFTPNNDGWNDVWKVILDLGCWVDIEFKIYNRWGGLVFEGYGDNYDSYPYWDGSMQGGPSYVADGVYVYTFKAKRWNSVEWYQRNGHITIFR